MEPLVSVDWLAKHLDDPDLRVFDATAQISRVLFLPRIRTGGLCLNCGTRSAQSWTPTG